MGFEFGDDFAQHRCYRSMGPDQAWPSSQPIPVASSVFQLAIGRPAHEFFDEQVAILDLQPQRAFKHPQKPLGIAAAWLVPSFTESRLLHGNALASFHDASVEPCKLSILGVFRHGPVIQSQACAG